jgi:dGTPase
MSTQDSQYIEFDCERKHKRGSTAEKRPDFEIDKARIIHSGAFRRLQGKTQVLGVGERDFYRTRLTHSLEVAQIGRGLCVEIPSPIKISQDLVEAICLAHDIGHSPFGHSGEKVLHKKLNGFLKNKADSKDKSDTPRFSESEREEILQGGGFGANPQNLRIVALLEPKVPEGGLDLTRATLDGLVKYPKQYDYKNHNESKSFYVSDKELFDWIKDGIKNKDRQPIEGQIADWADQMAYSINDMEDIVRAGLLNFSDMRSRKRDISEQAVMDFRKSREKRGEINAEPPADLLPTAIESLSREFESLFLAPSTLRDRKINLKDWTSKTIKRLKEGCRIESLGNDEKSIRYKVQFNVPAPAEGLSVLLKTVAFVLVFSDPRVKTLEAKGKLVIEALFEKFQENEGLLPLDFQEMIKLSSYGGKERLVVDFISGMTDRYAYSYYSRLTQPGSGSFYEFV